MDRSCTPKLSAGSNTSPGLSAGTGMDRAALASEALHIGVDFMTGSYDFHVGTASSARWLCSTSCDSPEGTLLERVGM